MPFGLFPTRDGRIAIAAPVEKHWKILCEQMQRLDLLEDERTATNAKRSANQTFTEAEVGKWTQTKSKAEIVAALGGRVPCGPANTMAEVFADPHTQARDMLQDYQLPGDNPKIPTVASPIKFKRSTTCFYQAPPKLGEHGDEILAEFGISPATK